MEGADNIRDDIEIEYRLAGLYYLANEQQKGQFHLVNALQNDSEYVIILEELFTSIYKRKSIQEIIKNNTK